MSYQRASNRGRKGLEIGDQNMKAWLGWFCVALVISLALAGCGSSNSSVVTISITPPSATVLVGTSVQFIPNVAGSTNALTWSVNGIANGDATTVGTISPTGLYTAPGMRPGSASGAKVPIVFAMANASIPNSGSTGAVIELQSGSDFRNFTPGNTITITGNSVAGWNGSFIIVAAATLQNGNVGVQIGDPAGPPANGVGGTAMATPNITITAQVQSTSAIASAIITLDSGIRVSISPALFTLGTGEKFQFLATVTGASSQPPSGPAVSWIATIGSIDANGNYKATGGPGTVTITATSVVDTSQSASARVTVINAVDPTVTSITPATGALGAVSEDIYLSGSNFISTTRVFVDGKQVDQSTVVPTGLSSSSSTSTILRVRLSGDALAVPNTGVANVMHTLTVASQNGSQSDPTQCQCQLALSAVRPAVVSASPDSVVQNGSSTETLHIHGGYFGTFNNPDVNVLFGCPSCVPTGSVSTTSPGRDFELPVTSTGTPGLFPVTVASNTAGLPPAVVNLAIQPALPNPFNPSSVSPSVGTQPVAVAIDTSTGIAAVANQGSNDVTLINLNNQTVVAPSIPVGAGPTSIAVDNLRNVALVGNGDSTLSVVDLNAQTVLFPPIPVNAVPAAIGVNPVSGKAIIAFQGAGFASIMDLTPLDSTLRKTPVISGVVQISTGPNARVAVSPKLNWALVSPGGAGTLSIVDLGRQTVKAITSISRSSSGTVTVTAGTTFALQAGQPVVITGVNDSSFNGLFTVISVANTSFTYSQSSSLGAANSSVGTVSSSLPVATVSTNTNVTGIAINDETEKAILVDPSGGVPAFIFNLLDQTSTLVSGSSGGNTAAAFNPFGNIAVATGRTNTQAFVIDPVTPSVLRNFSAGPTPVDVAIDPATNTAVIVNQGNKTVSLFSLGSAPTSALPQILQASPSQVLINSTLTSGPPAQNQSVTIIGAGFTSSSVVRLDGAQLTTTFVSNRELRATVPVSVPRRYALDVQNGAGVVSNAEGFAVIQSVSLIPGQCSSPAPQGVAIDLVHNVAVVTEPGTAAAPCNQVSLINLQSGMGVERAVGTNPQGVAVYPAAGLAVVANAGSNSVSIVDIAANAVPTSFPVDLAPTGVAIDLGTGNAVVTANGASLIDLFPVSTTAQTPTTIGVGLGPTGVAIDPTSHLAVVANSAGNTASLVDLIAHSTTHTTGTITFPQGVAFDPVSGAFLITSGASNQVIALDPVAGSVAPIRVGIDPSSIAYNFESGTLVTANSLSGTMTVVDFIDQTVRGVFSLQSSTQFAVDIDPQTNLAVVADPVDNQVLLVPLPH